jgi:RNA polymerase sigma-70 factor, ECF subfamily
MTENGKPVETAQTRDLLLRVQGGDLRAFNELFTQHRAALHRAVVRRLGRSLRGCLDPSDVVQDVQLEAMRRMADYLARRPMRFRPWLLRTAMERLLKVRRYFTAARRDCGREQQLSASYTSLSGHSPFFATADPTPSKQLAARDLACRLHAILDRLPEPDRVILRMRAFEGLSYEEAGGRLKIEPATARKRYGRALLRLRALLLADGLTESHL